MDKNCNLVRIDALNVQLRQEVSLVLPTITLPPNGNVNHVLPSPNGYSEHTPVRTSVSDTNREVSIEMDERTKTRSYAFPSFKA